MHQEDALSYDILVSLHEIGVNIQALNDISLELFLNITYKAQFVKIEK